MQEHRIDGEDKLTPGADMEDLARALDDERNMAVTMHKPGSIIKTAQGSLHRVEKDGSIRDLKPPKSVGPDPATSREAKGPQFHRGHRGSRR